MGVSELYTLIIGYSFIAAVFLVASALVRSTSMRWVEGVFAAIALSTCLYMAWVTKSVDPVSHLLKHVLVDRDPRHILALAIAVFMGGGIPVLLVFLQNINNKEQSRQAFGTILTVVSWAGISLCVWTIIWRDADILRFRAKLHDPRFEIEQVHQFAYFPIRIVSDEKGTVYANYDAYDNGFEQGGIVAFEYDESGNLQSQEVANSTLLFAAFGLAAKDGDLFVARTGLVRRAKKGRTSYDATGAITKLSDRDGDGQFEYYDDIVEDLPGQGLPDSQHQNNGLIFDDQGNLLATNGNPSDRQVPSYELEGTIIKVAKDTLETTVVANGFRNPYALAINKHGDLFVIDNDTTDNSGDEFNQVFEGAFYGHPFVIASDQDASGQTTQPIFSGSKWSHFAGMTYSDADGLPEELRDSFWIADTFRHQIVRVKLKPGPNGYVQQELQIFADLPGCVDVCITPRGQIFVLDRYNRRLYRIRRKTEADH